MFLMSTEIFSLLQPMKYMLQYGAIIMEVIIAVMQIRGGKIKWMIL